VEFRKRLVEKYGEVTIKWLESRKRQICRFSNSELELMYKHYNTLVKELESKL